MSDINL